MPLNEETSEERIAHDRELMVDALHPQRGIVDLLVTRRFDPSRQNRFTFSGKQRQMFLNQDVRDLPGGDDDALRIQQFWLTTAR
jgi:hypothetical protein